MMVCISTEKNAARTNYLNNSSINLMRCNRGMPQSIDPKPSAVARVDELKCVLMAFEFRECRNWRMRDEALLLIVLPFECRDPLCIRTQC